jgi:taurine dioxygenase
LRAFVVNPLALPDPAVAAFREGKAPSATSLRQALLADGMAISRANHLSETALIGLCRSFGKIDECDVPFFPEFPEIYPVAHSKTLGHVEIGRYWHADGAWRPTPVRFSFLYAASGNFRDNSTLFVRTDRVLDQMDEGLKALGRRIILKHPNGALQPVIRSDAATGIEYLHMNEGLLKRYLRTLATASPGAGRQAGKDVAVTGVNASELAGFLNTVADMLEAAPQLYRHIWQPGDLLAVDNLKFLHKAVPFGEQTTRVLYRVCVFA